MPDMGQVMLLSLIFMRMSGFILLNPILGRKNIPAIFKGGLIMLLTIMIYSLNPAQVPTPANSVEYAVLLLKEFAVGFAVAYVMELFAMVFTFGGAVIDFQMGLSMATVYDPQSNAQTALTGSIWNTYFMMLFFAVNGHLALIKIMVTAASVVPYGSVVFGQNALWAIAELFIECIVLGMKFAFPIIAIEFLTEIAVGILMKMIPQINVFVINIQAKVIIGLLMLLFLFSPMSDFLGNIMGQMLSTVRDILRLL